MIKQLTKTRIEAGRYQVVMGGTRFEIISSETHTEGAEIGGLWIMLDLDAMDAGHDAYCNHFATLGCAIDALTDAPENV